MPSGQQPPSAGELRLCRASPLRIVNYLPASFLPLGPGTWVKQRSLDLRQSRPFLQAQGMNHDWSKPINCSKPATVISVPFARDGADETERNEADGES